jgi:predicted Zn-dependent peptidase
MKKAFLITLALSLAASAWAAKVPEGLVQSFTLDNGLRVLVVERHESPTVACVIGYDVGAADEPVGKTGMAHLLEHLMFKGSERFGTTDWAKEKPLFDQANAETRRWIGAADAALKATPPGVLKGEDKLPETEALTAEDAKLKEILDQERKYIIKDEFWGTYDRHGGRNQNAFTGQDRTMYFVLLPANKLELWGIMESERMTRALFREYYSERSVIMEEKRLSDETDPDSAMWDTLNALAFPVHPYGRPVVGYWDDLRHMTVEDVTAFYRAYYKPNNAVAVVIGDVTANQVKGVVQKYFGPIPKGDVPKRLWTTEPPMDGPRQGTVIFDAKPQAIWAYRVPSKAHPDFPALELAANILGGGESSRLNLRLVLKDKIAQSAYSWCFSGRDPELFQVGCAPFEGHSVDEVEKAIREEIRKLAKDGPDPKELQKVKNQANSQIIYRLESPVWLAISFAGSEITDGDWRESYRYLDRINAVTAEDIKRVLQKYVSADHEIKVTLRPKEKKP